MSEYIKDGYLAEALRNELVELRGEPLRLAQEAIVEIATSGVPGTFDDLIGAYRRAIRRALHPERKLVKSPQVDRKIIKNPSLATQLDRELKDVTAEELARVNAALKKVLDEAREVTVTKGGVGEERFVKHPQTETCDIRNEKEHSTLPGDDNSGCGYFKAPDAWAEVLLGVVRKALAE
jgi:hypothetical protein